MTVNQAAEGKLREQSLHQIYMLTAMFLLGMAVNLIGLPSETGGAAKTATTIFMGLHGLIGLGLVAGAVLAVRFAAKGRSSQYRLALVGLLDVLITFATGVLTMTAESSWWSYAMSAGFMAAVLAYGAIVVRTKA